MTVGIKYFLLKYYVDQFKRPIICVSTDIISVIQLTLCIDFHLNTYRYVTIGKLSCSLLFVL